MRPAPRGFVRATVPSALGVLAAGLLVPAVVAAAGLEIPENGALMLGRGGTAVSLPGSAYALQFNPAGMSDLVGLDVRLDARLVNHEVRFTRERRIDRERNIDDTFLPVTNQGGPFLGPSATVAYRLPELPFAIGLGVWGPPGVGRYTYPDPKALHDGGELVYENGLATGQRYGVIQSATRVLFPSVGLAWQATDALSLGVSFQSTVALVSMKQAIAARSNGGGEFVTADGIATLDLVDPFTPSFMLGVLWAPMPGLRFGASFRPTIDLEAEGTLKIDTLLGGDAIKFEGDRARLRLTLPSMARAGVTWQGREWLLSGELVYEGWSANKAMVLEGQDIKVTIGGTTTPLPSFTIRKNWRDSAGLRFGGSLPLLSDGPGGMALTFHCGALLETNAIPESRQNIDTVTGDRAGAGLGVTARWGGFAVTVSGMGYIPVTMVVTGSEASRGVAASPDSPPVLVGNGIYESKIVIGSIGLAWSGLGAAR